MSARANEECKALWDANKLRDVTPFSPPRPDGAWGLMSIGAIGGVDWGGAAIDLDHDYAIVNVANIPTMITVTKTQEGVKGNGGLRSASGNVRFADNEGRSCNGGRQGELVAVNLSSGQIAWRVPLGSLEDEYGEGARDMGANSIGPTLVNPWRNLSSRQLPTTAFMPMIRAPASCCGRPGCRLPPMRGR